ncbi:MAG: two component transcriptional regulator, winged helix family [Acidobacteria bacterium]|nr:two component transcriptional regulator, winged helix family [Acidobacteriota bacterium]
MRLLLVEDDDGIVNFLEKGIREAKYAVDVARDGDDALYKAALTEYDAIILDIMIPGPDGLEVCRELRRLGSKVPVIMLTARDDLEDRIRGLDTGADDYLTKPFQVSELLARLRALMRRGHELKPAVLTVGDLQIDTAAQTVRRSGRSLALTAREYALLEYLARNADRVVSRSELMDHVWDERFDPYSNVVDVHINHLRQKLVRNSEQPLIHTRRGAGYILSTIVAAVDDE